MKLDVQILRYLTRDDFRVLTSLEQGMKNHDVVPTELISVISGLRSGVGKVLSNLLRHKLIYHDASLYDGYRLTYPGYDFLALRTLMQRGVISGVGRQIGVGKESDIYLGTSEAGDLYALKLQRLGRTSFRAVKRTRDYLKGRRSVGWLYMSRLATQKEFAFMSALHDAGFPTPIPVATNRHLLVMSLAPGRTLSICKALPWAHPTLPGLVFDRLMELVMRLAACGLVHCDFNEFNVLMEVGEREDGGEEGGGIQSGGGGGGGGDAAAAAAAASPHTPQSRGGLIGGGDTGLPPITITMIDFPQMVSLTHPNAMELFERDVQCLVLFFQRRFGYTPPKWPTFEAAKQAARAAAAAEREGGKEGGGGGGGLAGLDWATEASGFKTTARDDTLFRPGTGIDLPRAFFSAVESQGFHAKDSAALEALLAEQEGRGEGGGEEGEGEEEAIEGGAGEGEEDKAVDESFVAPTEDILGAIEEEEDVDGEEGEEEEEEGEREDDEEEKDLERNRAHEAALLAERPLISRTRPNGRRVRDSVRGGEAYLIKKREQAEQALLAAAEKEGGEGAAPGGSVLDPKEIAARVRRVREREQARSLMAAASAKAGKGRGSQKDREKQKSRETTKSAKEGGGVWG